MSVSQNGLDSVPRISQLWANKLSWYLMTYLMLISCLMANSCLAQVEASQAKQKLNVENPASTKIQFVTHVPEPTAKVGDSIQQGSAIRQVAHADGKSQLAIETPESLTQRLIGKSKNLLVDARQSKRDTDSTSSLLGDLLQKPETKFLFAKQRAAESQVSPLTANLSPQVELITEPSVFQPIESLTTKIGVTAGLLPEDQAPADAWFKQEGKQVQVMGTNRDHTLYNFNWTASNLRHQPLYFEDVNLERHGLNYGILQPVVSGAHFFGRVPLIPYMRGAENPREPVYTLGHYRIGSEAPYMRHRLPFSWKGLTYEAGAATGLIFLVP